MNFHLMADESKLKNTDFWPLAAIHYSLWSTVPTFNTEKLIGSMKTSVKRKTYAQTNIAIESYAHIVKCSSS